jgi:hypothetical protein
MNGRPCTKCKASPRHPAASPGVFIFYIVQRRRDNGSPPGFPRDGSARRFLQTVATTAEGASTPERQNRESGDPGLCHTCVPVGKMWMVSRDGFVKMY